MGKPSFHEERNRVVRAMGQPEKRFRAGGCEAAIFENEITRNGRAGTLLKKVAFQKRYKSAEGGWKTTYSLDVNDIPRAIVVLSKAYEYLVLESQTEEESEKNAVDLI